MSQADKSYDQLLANLGSDGPLPSQSVGQSIQTECTTDLKPVQNLSKTKRVLLCSAMALLVILSLVVASSKGTESLATSAIYGTAGWALVMLAILSVGFGNHNPQSKAVRVGFALGIPVLFFGYLALCRTGWLPIGEFLFHDGHCLEAFHCGAIAMGLGSLAAGSVLYVWRRSDPFNPRLQGALAGLIGGMAGALSIGLVCPGNEGWHLLLGHGIGVVLLAVAGAAIGRRVLAP